MSRIKDQIVLEVYEEVSFDGNQADYDWTPKKVFSCDRAGYLDALEAASQLEFNSTAIRIVQTPAGKGSNPLMKMDDEDSRRYWEFLEKNSKVVSQMSPVQKGEPVSTDAPVELDLGPMGSDLGLFELQELAHENSVSKGFYDGEANIGEKLMLIVTEVAEAMEAYRNSDWDPRKSYLVDGKPEGVGIELADVVIRVADLAAHLGLDLTDLVRHKMEHNSKRPFKHGGRRV